MTHKISSLIYILALLVVVSLALQLIPLPEHIYTTAFILLVGVAARVFELREAAIGREAQGNTSEASVEPSKDIKLPNNTASYDKHNVYYNGYSIPAAKVFVIVGYDADANNVITPVYRSIDKVYVIHYVI